MLTQEDQLNKTIAEWMLGFNRCLADEAIAVWDKGEADVPCYTGLAMPACFQLWLQSYLTYRWQQIIMSN